MRLAFVYDAIWPWETGGVQKRVWELSRRLASDHDVHWYGLKYWDGPEVIEREGVTIHGVGVSRDLYVGGRRSITEAITFSAQLMRPLLRADVDVIDCQEFPYFPIFASKFGAVRNNATLCVTWHEVWGSYWQEYLGYWGLIGRAVERISARPPDFNIAVSDQTQRDILDLGVDEATILPNGIATREIEAVPAGDEPIDTLFVGRLISEKGVDMLIDAVTELQSDDPDVSCLLVGEGPEEATLKAMIESQGLDANVRLVPFREQYEDILGLMKAAEVFVLPSRREGFGISVLEALACGTPVVTIDHPRNAATELVEDGVTGVVADPMPKAIAAAIVRARCEADEGACRAFASDYDWDRISQRAATLYQGMI